MKLYRQMVDDLTRMYPEGEARALVRRMFEDGFGLSQTDVLLDKDSELSADDIVKAKEIVNRLLHHEPIQYILGSTLFCGHRFLVGRGALIPRPETAELVERACSYATADFSGAILDIGTGTGCIALSLALALPGARVTAWDVSPEALAVARRNADLYPEAGVVLEQADILAPPADDRLWQIIISNPPYVRQSEACQMEQNVLQHEPHQALFVPDDDPLRFYRAIGCYAQSHLPDGGRLFLEINQALGAETSHLIEKLGFCDVRVETDSFGCDRFVVATRNH